MISLTNIQKEEPPRIARWLLQRLSTYVEKFSIIDDFEEEFDFLLLERGKTRARLWYRFQTIQALRFYLITLFKWSFIMFKNYLKIALRNITKHKAYSLINISGLAIGMACTVLILLWIQDELSTDRFHKHIDNLYKVVERQDYSGSEFYLTDNTPGPLAQALKEQFAEVADSTRFLYGGRRPVRYGDKNYDEPLCFTDPSFFNMFTFPLTKGNKKNVLKEPSSIVITEEMAAKYFGNEDPLGKILNLDNRYDFKVTGVLKDIPHNTHLYFFDFLLPFSQADEFVGGSFENWGRNWPWTYLLLQEGTSTKEYEKKSKVF